MKSGSLNLLEPSGPVQPCTGNALPLLYIKIMTIRICKLRSNKFSPVSPSRYLVEFRASASWLIAGKSRKQAGQSCKKLIFATYICMIYKLPPKCLQTQKESLWCKPVTLPTTAPTLRSKTAAKGPTECLQYGLITNHCPYSQK
jgi:hypothetical protein